MLNFVEEQTGAAKIKVIGVGGGGICSCKYR